MYHVDFCTSNEGNEERGVGHQGDVFEPCAIRELVEGVEGNGQGGAEEEEVGEEELHYSCGMSIACVKDVCDGGVQCEILQCETLSFILPVMLYHERYSVFVPYILHVAEKYTLHHLEALPYEM
jgi:hypothetical protein